MPGLLDILNSDDDGVRLGLGLLAAAAPSTTPTNNAARLAQAFGYVQQQKNQDVDRAYKNALVQKQTMEMDAIKRQLLDDQTTRDILKQYSQGRTNQGAGMGATNLVNNALPPEFQIGAQPSLMPAGQQSGYGGRAPEWQRYKDLGDKFSEAGLVKQADAYYELAQKNRPKFSTTPQVVRDPSTGQLVNILVSEDGTTQQMGYGVKPDINLQALGDRVVALDKNALQNGASFAMGQSPDSKASNSLGWARLGFDRDNANRGVTVQTDSNGNLVAIPNRMTPGQPLQAIPVMGQGGQPLQGKDGGLNDTQSKALLFGNRMQDSDKIINDLAKQGVYRPGFIRQAAGNIPGLDSLTNSTQSSQQQQVEQAQRDFLNAVLRRESGAAISRDEFESGRRQYFPQVGDSLEVINQKAKNRQLATAGILAEVPQNRRTITPQINTFGQQPQGQPTSDPLGLFK